MMDTIVLIVEQVKSILKCAKNNPIGANVIAIILLIIWLIVELLDITGG